MASSEGACSIINQLIDQQQSFHNRSADPRDREGEEEEEERTVSPWINVIGERADPHYWIEIYLR